MDKKEALNFLAMRSNEIARLAKLPYTNQDVILWRNSIEDVLENVFGLNSTEYKRFYETRISIKSRMTQAQKQNLYKIQMQRRQTEIYSILNKYEIFGVEEKTDEIDTSIKSHIQLFDAMQLHPTVIEVSVNLFKTGNYPQAVSEAFKAVNNYVKKATGLIQDGTPLMERVFNENKPILKVNDLLTLTDKNEQSGFKHIFMGCQLGIRNLGAHENVKQGDPKIALEYLCLASLLLRRIDNSKFVKLNIDK